MLNHEQYQNLWPQIKLGLRNMWGVLDEDELEQTHGDLSSVASIVQDKTGEDRGQIKDKLDQLLSSFDNETDKGFDPDRSGYHRSPVNVDWNPRH
jgi:uncharacterized protein YjbJ (UPF0337 family)